MRKELTDLIRARPFIPFVVHMSGGDSYTAQHPENAMLTSAALYVYDPDEVHRCSLLHVTGLMVKETVS
jgi:hypothetical protein